MRFDVAIGNRAYQHVVRVGTAVDQDTITRPRSLVAVETDTVLLPRDFVFVKSDTTLYAGMAAFPSPGFPPIC